MGPSQQKYVDRIVARAQPLVAPGETVRVAWSSVRGIGSSKLMLLTYVTQLLLVFQTFRVIAITDTTVYVFKSGWFTRFVPKKLLFTLPLRGAIVLTGPRGRFQVGPEKLKVDRPFLTPLVEQAASYR